MHKQLYSKYVLMVKIIKVLISIEIIFASYSKLIIYCKLLTHFLLYFFIIEFENSFIIH